ncbi:MAG: choice-of-anchor A family protein [Phycisphaeraceae bacterium]|nr:choice-of-anchor A family protein [Phycisphaeraceae bacterium]
MQPGFVRAVSLAAAVSCSALSAHAGVIGNFNLALTGSLTSTSEVEGRAFIGGNLQGSASNYGTMLFPRPAFLGTDVLVVGGNITATGVNVEAGNLRLGGIRTGFANFNGGGSQINDPTVAAMVPTVAAELASTSAFLAGLAPNSSVQLPMGQPGPAIFNAAPSGPDNIAVFSISAASLFGNGLVQQIELNANGASSIIVNVTGASVLHNGGNFVGGWTSQFARAHAMWNFVDATSITVDRAFYGAMLAPGAAITNSTVIEGSVFASSMIQNGEVHLPNYQGFIPAPGAAVTLAAGLLAFRRRRA